MSKNLLGGSAVTPTVSASDFPKSGFDLSYSSRLNLQLGRLHPQMYQHIMPADKFRGTNEGNITFESLTVPEISDVEVSQHNFYVPYRSIDNTFIKGIVPTSLNNMSSAWHTPNFNLAAAVKIYLEKVNFGFKDPKSGEVVIKNFMDLLDEFEKNVFDPVSNSAFIFGDFDFHCIPSTDVYMLDYAADLSYHVVNSLKGIRFGFLPGETPTTAPIFAFLDAVLTPLFGENSLLDLLGYSFLRRSDLLHIANNILNIGLNYEDAGGEDDLRYFTSYLDQVPMCEYALRAYYAIWFEHYRDPNLEARNNVMLDWRDFGSSSVVLSSYDALFQLLSTRIRSWAKDLYVGAQPDDIYRHVYAPIIQNVTNTVHVKKTSTEYEDAEALTSGNSQIVDVGISYVEPSTGETKSITCPIPSRVNDILSSNSEIELAQAYGLDLRDLQKSQMLQRYLKRNFYFGDEYEDRMLAHYGSKVSDNSIRRPHILSSSVTNVQPSQEIASVGTEQTPVGTRTAIASVNPKGDGFEFFAEEFGIVIGLISVMPVAQYSGLCPQNLISKTSDFPLPEFAANNDEMGRVLEVANSGLRKDEYLLSTFGHYPYAHAYRARVNEVHGDFLSYKQDYTFRRFFGLDSELTYPKLNYGFIHCHPNLGMFLSNDIYVPQAWLKSVHKFFVERVLPAPVEEI